MHPPVPLVPVRATQRANAAFIRTLEVGIIKERMTVETNQSIVRIDFREKCARKPILLADRPQLDTGTER